MTLDHKDQTLHITWQKDNQDEASQCENVMNLSGGERSFTTLSLLLAICTIGVVIKLIRKLIPAGRQGTMLGSPRGNKFGARR